MTETNVAMAAGTELVPVTVKLSKLTEGIGMVFAGVLTMLECLDASSARKLVEGFAQADETAGRENAEVQEEISDGTENANDGTGNAGPADDATHVMVEAPKGDSPAPSVTQDDITKIIVQKLKKDRSNNEKIGAILKTYGVAKVSELSADKYEAFLTDLSQL